jgi:SAM-dependent methyltransferase
MSLQIGTTRSPYGVVSSLSVADVDVRVVRDPAQFRSYCAQLGAAPRGTIPGFQVADACGASRPILLLAEDLSTAGIRLNQDVAFRSRRTLGAVFDPFLEHLPVTRRRPARVEAASWGLILSCAYRYSLPDEVGPAAARRRVLLACAIETQREIDRRVDALVDAKVLPPAGSLITDVHRPDYSHIDLMAWIFAVQVRQIRDAVLRQSSGTTVVVDVGAGVGGFTLAAARYFASRGLGDRVHFVAIDAAEECLEICRSQLTDSRCRVELFQDDLLGDGFADRLRARGAQFIVANHVLEHLPLPHAVTVTRGDTLEPLKNVLLHDLILAAGEGVFVAVPLNDDPVTTISNHERMFTPHDVVALATSMPSRCADAIRHKDLELTQEAGVILWERVPGDFTGPYLPLTPRDGEAGRDPSLLSDFAVPFDPARFGVAKRALKIGELEDKARFEMQGAMPRQVRQLPIKMPGSDVCLPVEFSQLAEFVQRCIDHNRAVNPGFHGSYVYLNVFRGFTSFHAYRGLSLNLHGDQLQTLRPGFAYAPDYSYICSNTLPTTLFHQAFDVSRAVELAAAGQAANVYDDFARQAEPAAAYSTDNFGVYLLSPYIVHAASESPVSVYRVFAKVAVSTKRFFDNRELRRNRAFDYHDWYTEETVGYLAGFFHHAHFNERYLASGLLPTGQRWGA